MEPSTILITRPIEQALESAIQFRRYGFKTFIEPFLFVTLLPFSLPKNNIHTYYITTSSHAILSLAKVTPERRMILWCVGEKSYTLAKSLGFLRVYTPEKEKTAKGLLTALIEKLPRHASIVYLRGNYISTDLSLTLKKRGYSFLSLVVYRVDFTPSLSSSCLEQFKKEEFLGITIYSENTLKRFLWLKKRYKINDKRLYFLSLSKKIDQYFSPSNKPYLIIGRNTEELAKKLYDSGQKIEPNL